MTTGIGCLADGYELMRQFQTMLGISIVPGHDLVSFQIPIGRHWPSDDSRNISAHQLAWNESR